MMAMLRMSLRISSKVNPRKAASITADRREGNTIDVTIGAASREPARDRLRERGAGEARRPRPQARALPSAPHGASDSQGAAFLRAALVELLSRYGIRERGERAARIDLGLGALGLQLGEDLGQLGNLPLVEIELERQVPERPPDPEGAGADL